MRRTRAAQHPKVMCEAVVKAVVIKAHVVEGHLLSVEREDMCEDDDMWKEAAGQEDQDFDYEGLRDSTTGEDLDASQARAGCDEELE